MSKQVYIDENGNEIQVSGTVNTADMMPMSGNDSTKVSEAIGDLSTLTTTDKSSIVGAVNEVNANLVTSGSNANGNYIKYADGTMICTKTANTTGEYSAWGNVFISDTMDLGSFPQTFYSTPVSIVQAGDTQTAGAVINNTDVSTTSAGKVRTMRGTATTGTMAFTFNVIAIGRWKA